MDAIHFGSHCQSDCWRWFCFSGKPVVSGGGDWRCFQMRFECGGTIAGARFLGRKFAPLKPEPDMCGALAKPQSLYRLRQVLHFVSARLTMYLPGSCATA